MDTENKNNDGKVFSLHDFRQKKSFATEHAPGRKPLYVSHKQGKMSGSPHLENSHLENTDLSERVRRIRDSLDKINNLMTELKKMSKND